MSTTFAAKAPRQALIFAAIAGLHIGAFFLMASGLGPYLEFPLPAVAPISLVPPAPLPIEIPPPGMARPLEYTLPRWPMPQPDIPRFPDERILVPGDGAGRGERTGAGPDLPERPYTGPAFRLGDNRLAALIDACYPSSARRAGEQGRVTVRVVIDAGGRVSAWNIAEGSGFPRLDAAVDCVIRRLAFAPARRDGRSVEATVMLPIVFRLD